MPKTRHRIVALSLVALAFAALPAAASASKTMELGIQDDSLVNGNPPVNPAPLLKSLGIQRERIIIQWNSVETSPGSYDMTSWVNAAAAARIRGHQVNAVLTGPAPSWASSGSGGFANPDPAKYAAFAQAASQALAPYVNRYSVWNEPNWLTLLVPRQTAPQQYAALYSAGAPAIRVGDPGSQVIFGEMQPGTKGTKYGYPPLTFLQKVFCANSKWQAKCNTGLTADGVALHPYTLTTAPNKKSKVKGSVTMANLSALTSALDKLAKGGGLKPSTGSKMRLYLTEYAYRTTGKQAPSSKNAAKWLSQAYSIARKNTRVASLFHYQLFYPPGKPLWNSGIVQRNGKKTQSFNSLAKWVKKYR